MSQALVIYLTAPMASFGEAPGNALRGTANRPTRSAMLGLAGAALGIRRDDQDGQQALSDSFSVVTRTLTAGHLLTDFHTFEGVKMPAKRPAQTRADALANGSRTTSISRREYRCDGHWQVAFQPTDQATTGLNQLGDAFKHPRFTLFLGRKSCPLSHPLVPQVLEYDDLETLFEQALAPIAITSRIKRDDASTLIAFDTSNARGAELAKHKATALRRRRMDQPASRQSWTFQGREEMEFMTGGRTNDTA